MNFSETANIRMSADQTCDIRMPSLETADIAISPIFILFFFPSLFCWLIDVLDYRYTVAIRGRYHTSTGTVPYCTCTVLYLVQYCTVLVPYR
jgi:hypothetical protein